MIISVSLFCILLFVWRGTKPLKFVMASYLTSYQIIATLYLSQKLELIQYSNRSRLFQWAFPSLRGYLLAIILALGIGKMAIKVGSLYKQEKENLKSFQLLATFIAGVFIFLGMISLTGASWMKATFGNIGIEELLYTISQPIKGTDRAQVLDFVWHPLLRALFLSFSVVLSMHIVLVVIKQVLSLKHGKLLGRTFTSFFTLAMMVFGITSGINEIGYAELKTYFLEKTNLYEEEYINPNNVALTFPEKKRNLLFLFVESLETTYLSKELGGQQTANLLPNLTRMGKEELFFSSTDGFGGALEVPGASFTVGSMVGQTSGIPLRVVGGVQENNYEQSEIFMPGVTSLGDILAKEGYHQTLLIGSDAGFAGRDKYFSQHGNYEILDYNYAKQVGWIPEKYKVWWGYEDTRLFQFAQNELTRISQQDQPFNFTMLTVDTHFPNGYVDENTPELFENQYANVIHFSDEMIGAFLGWVKEQPFYENTTVIVSGDHLSMDQDFFTKIDPNYQRTIFHTILNAPIQPEGSTINRQFSVLDFFPTTLAALDVKIEGDRLGLGTNLFSTEPTIIERIGYETLRQELSKSSTFYTQNIMQGTDLNLRERY